MRVVQTVVLFSAVVLALTVPPPPPPHAVDYPSPHSPAIGSSAPHAISVYFSIPCEGCFPDPSEELDIELTIDTSNAACQSSAVTINHVKLAKQSSILFKASTSIGPQPHDVIASWETLCLDNEVTLLTLHINEVLGSKRIQQSFGFSSSFRQGNSPAFLRLEQAPLPDWRDARIEQKWTKPQEDPEFVVVQALSPVDEQLPNEVQVQLRRLYEIKAHMARLHHKSIRQEQRIFKMITKDFHTCQGPTCIFQTAIKKAPDFFELVKAHFKQHPTPHGMRSHLNHGPPQAVAFDVNKDFDRHRHSVEDMPQHTQDLEYHRPPPNNFDSEDLPPPPPPPPFKDDEPPPHRHHGHPPPHPDDCHRGPQLPPPPPHDDKNSSPLPPPPSHHLCRPQRPGDRHGGHHKPGHPKPHEFHSLGPQKHPFFFSIGSILVFIIVATLLFKCVRAKTGLFRNNQRQRDRAARREECCNQAAYRRAALRHKWQQWWSQFRRPESTADYEEKRARLLDQEDALEDVMQTEIRELRRAHELVGDLMRAEEGRQRHYHEANYGSSSRSTNRYDTPPMQAMEIDQSITSTLPLYQPPPPSYDQELAGEIMVVDGFSYTPSATDSTPASSVVDCDTRMSFETGTTTLKD